ncbi:hypothetical protein NA56DRAFT_696599 [Hyaloscypha hepaticicola]|uniref:Uncharacterized protein n=1 Tax=Hyaloscypha hepaticicola TaxID=2082293 RepID=A0A2J6QMW9_9HELO|nr:hypothetical protein NA56DRAFT_696599 [Hyaloscypha hepaticicola]
MAEGSGEGRSLQPRGCLRREIGSEETATNCPKRLNLQPPRITPSAPLQNASSSNSSPPIVQLNRLRTKLDFLLISINRLQATSERPKNIDTAQRSTQGSRCLILHFPLPGGSHTIRKQRVSVKANQQPCRPPSPQAHSRVALQVHGHFLPTLTDRQGRSRLLALSPIRPSTARPELPTSLPSPSPLDFRLVPTIYILGLLAPFTLVVTQSFNQPIVSPGTDTFTTGQRPAVESRTNLSTL